MDSNTRSRFGMLTGLAAVAGCFGVAAMMSAATAPAARADDFSAIVADVESEIADGQTAFGQAATDFSSSDPIDGFQALLNGTNDYLSGVPDNLYLGTVEALTGTSISPNLFEFSLTPPSDFSDAVSDAQSSFSGGENAFAEAATDLSSGDYAAAAYADALGSAYTFDLPADYLLIGGLEALGF
jgi:hypothetical protein